MDFKSIAAYYHFIREIKEKKCGFLSESHTYSNLSVK